MPLKRRSLPALALLVLLATRGQAVASSESPAPTDVAVVRQAISVVAGTFTEERSVSVREYRDQYDEQGRPTVHREAITTVPFIISERLDGEPLPPRILVNIVGGEAGDVRTPMSLALPGAGQRVVLGVLPDSRGPGSHVVVHARVFDARSDARLAELRQWVRATRAAVPIPQGEPGRSGEPGATGAEEPDGPAYVNEVTDIPRGYVPPRGPEGTPREGPLRGEPVMPGPGPESAAGSVAPPPTPEAPAPRAESPASPLPRTGPAAAPEAQPGAPAAHGYLPWWMGVALVLLMGLAVVLYRRRLHGPPQ